MIGHDLHLDDAEPVLRGHLARDFLEAGVDAVHEHPAAVLRAEDHVILAAEHDVVVASILHRG